MYATEYKDYTIKLVCDEDPESPREWDNLGTLCLDHRRNVLPWEYAGVDKDHPVYYVGGSLWQPRQCYTWADLKIAIEQAVARDGDQVAVILPVYAYDHGVFDLSTQIEPYWWHASWDSGQVGFIFVTVSKVRHEYGWRKLTAVRRAQISKNLTNEVKTFSQWLNGDVWLYDIEDEDGEVVESCGGFYGYDAAEEAAKEEVDRIILHKELVPDITDLVRQELEAEG